MELERRTTAPAHATGAVEFVPLEAVADDATFRLRDEGDVSGLAASIGRLGQLVPVELRPLAGAPEDPPRYQVVAGFRRLAALRLLARERVLARVHERLDDDDAWGLALGLALLAEPLLANELAALRERLAAAGLAPWAADLVDDALARAPVDPKLRERFLAYLARTEADAPAGEDEDGEGEDGPETAAEQGVPADVDAGAEPSPGEEDREEEDRAVEVTPDELAGDLAQRMFEANQDLAVAFESWAELPPEGRRMIVEQARYVAEVLRLLEEEGE